MKFGKTLGLAIVVGALAAISACQKQEGPAERAGKEIDQAASKAGQQIEKAGENIQDAARGDSKPERK